MYTVLDTSAEKQWRAILPAHRSVFGSVEYARIVEAHTHHAARLFAVEADGVRTAYPFFLRAISDLPFASNGARARGDTVSPEYTGPFATVGAGDGENFRACWKTYCQAQGIIAEFAHLNPWECEREALDPSGIQPDREIVHVNLELSEQELWDRSLTYACRKNIRRAQAEKVRVRTATTADEIIEFQRVYIETMTRNHAHAKYFFPVTYFMQFFEQMPQHARFVLAASEERIIAGTLYLHDEANVYSYLGGADAKYQNLRPTNAIVYDTMLWAKQHGKKRLVLGGGYHPDDGIFRFKSSFSPLRTRFHVYKQIHEPAMYAALCDDRDTYYALRVEADSYFPAYRSIPVLKDALS